jgi:hypothetical protein
MNEEILNETCKNTQLSSFMRAITDSINITPGPKGIVKILQSICLENGGIDIVSTKVL